MRVILLLCMAIIGSFAKAQQHTFDKPAADISCTEQAEKCITQCDDAGCKDDCKESAEDCGCRESCSSTKDEQCQQSCDGQRPISLTALVRGCPAGISAALWLAIDGSGSVSTAEMNLQCDGYISGLSSVIPAHYNRVAIGISVFSSGNVVLYPLTVMNAVTLAQVVNKLTFLKNNRNTVLPPGGTNIAGALTFASNQFGGYTDCNKTIDLSTDGRHPAAATVATSLHTTSGFNINCLLIPPADCAFVSGVGSVFSAANFGQVGATLKKKLTFEIGPPPPPPPPPVVDCHDNCPLEEQQCKRKCRSGDRDCIKKCEAERLDCHRECCCHEGCPEDERACKRRCKLGDRACIKKCEEERVNCHWKCCRDKVTVKPWPPVLRPPILSSTDV